MTELQTTAAAPRPSSLRANVTYIVFAFILGTFTAMAEGAHLSSGDGIGRCFGPPLLGVLIGGIRAGFGKTSIPKWMFWMSFVSYLAALVNEYAPPR